MLTPAVITVHPGQFPEVQRAELLGSLRSRHINHKFHYESVRQTQKWLTLHRAYSPSYQDADCEHIYREAFSEVTGVIKAGPLQLVSLCCGDGLKEQRLIRELVRHGSRPSYVPSDSSVPMVLMAARAASPMVSRTECRSLVCDFESANDLSDILKSLSGPADLRRLVSFFGTIHNYPPLMAAARLSSILRRNDLLLVGANLAPEHDYIKAVQRIAKQYDNGLTHDWLCTFLFDLGITHKDGKAETVVERCPYRSGLLRIAIYFRFSRTCAFNVGSERFSFRQGQRIRLFFSYRYTPMRLEQCFRGQRISVLREWISSSEEEGLFLCRKYG